MTKVPEKYRQWDLWLVRRKICANTTSTQPCGAGPRISSSGLYKSTKFRHQVQPSQSKPKRIWNNTKKFHQRRLSSKWPFWHGLVEWGESTFCVVSMVLSGGGHVTSRGGESVGVTSTQLRNKQNYWELFGARRFLDKFEHDNLNSAETHFHLCQRKVVWRRISTSGTPGQTGAAFFIYFDFPKQIRIMTGEDKESTENIVSYYEL